MKIDSVSATYQPTTNVNREITPTRPQGAEFEQDTVSLSSGIQSPAAVVNNGNGWIPPEIAGRTTLNSKDSLNINNYGSGSFKTETTNANIINPLSDSENTNIETNGDGWIPPE